MAKQAKALNATSAQNVAKLLPKLSIRSTIAAR
jgi:hypothetical protein